MNDLGEWKQQVPIKLDVDTIRRIDQDVQRFAPFCEGRSTVARVLIQFAYAAIDAGILKWDLQSVQDVLSNSRPVNGAVPSVLSVPKGAKR